MFDPSIILARCRGLGLTVRAEGARLAISPARLCPPDLLDALRAHKLAVMGLLEAESASQAPACRPWLHIALQVMAGEFDGADRDTVESVSSGLSGVTHPVCARALARLRPALRATGCTDDQ